MRQNHPRHQLPVVQGRHSLGRKELRSSPIVRVSVKYGLETVDLCCLHAHLFGEGLEGSPFQEMHRHLSTQKNADRQDHRVSGGSSPTLSRPLFPAPLLKNSDDGDDAVSLHAAPTVVGCCFPTGSSCVLRSRLVVSKSTAIAPIISRGMVGGALQRLLFPFLAPRKHDPAAIRFSVDLLLHPSIGWVSRLWTVRKPQTRSVSGLTLPYRSPTGRGEECPQVLR